MKVKTGFLLHSMGEEHVVVPVDERTLEFPGMIRLNRTGAFLFECMQKEFEEQDLVEKLLGKYEVSEEKARASVRKIVDSLVEAGVVE